MSKITYMRKYSLLLISPCGTFLCTACLLLLQPTCVHYRTFNIMSTCSSSAPPQECRGVGVECIVAPYEADAQLTYLQKEGIVDYIISEDSDMLVFGCTRVGLRYSLRLELCLYVVKWFPCESESALALCVVLLSGAV